jgi:UDP-glucose:(glucosyl)LPS alpha-1,2-glucosyltransferase
MAPAGARVVMILPPREHFAPHAAGAISLVVRRYCALTPGAVVMGTLRPQTFDGIAYQPVRGFASTLRALRRLAPDVVEVHQQPRLAMLLALALPGRRISLFLHNDPLTMRGLRTRFGRRFALSLLYRVVCVSEFLAARYRTGLSGVGPAVLPNPLSIAELPPRAPQRRKTLLFVGRINTNKAPDVFIAACAQSLPHLPGWTARMIGGDHFGPDSPDRPQTDYVMAMREEAGRVGVAFEGPRPHAEVLMAMAEAAIVVVPSRWDEPFGLTALEALASGAALITTGQGGLREVAGEAALFVPPGDAQATAAAIISLATDEASRAALVEAGLAQAARFETASLAGRLEALRPALC